jgi:hypothetical protein
MKLIQAGFNPRGLQLKKRVNYYGSLFRKEEM